MFKYDERIFNEIHEVDFDPMANEYFMENIYPQIVEKEDDDPICIWSIDVNDSGLKSEACNSVCQK